jgi:hypothetical protein
MKNAGRGRWLPVSRMLQDAENITVFAWHIPMSLVGKVH